MRFRLAFAATLGGVVVAVACGGTAPAKPAGSSPHPTRRVIEDTSEDEPTDGVEVISTRGHMDPAAVQAGIEPHTGDLSACYTERVGKRRWLGGHVTIHWDIAKAGVITAVKLSESDLGAWEIEQCLIDVAKAATFAKPIGGDADFTLPLEFSAKGKSTPWDEDRSLRSVGGQLAELDACHEPDSIGEDGKPLKPAHKPKRHAAPSAHGAVVLPDDVLVTLYVGPGGRMESVGFASAKSVIDAAWAACATRVAAAWRLPDPRGTMAKLAIKYRPGSE